MKMKYIVGAGLLLLASVGWAQNGVILVDISADDLLSGSADEQLQTLGAQAVAEDKSVIITAPEYWRELIEEQLVAGASGEDLDIRFRSTFIESVMVRLTTPVAPPTPPKPEPKPAVATTQPAAQPAPTPKAPEVDVDAAVAAADALKESKNAVQQDAEESLKQLVQEIPRAEPIIAPPPLQGQPPQQVEDASATEEPVVVSQADTGQSEADPTETAEPQADNQVEAAAPTPAVADAVPSDAAPIVDIQAAQDARAYFERQLQGGREITRTLDVSGLRRGDEIAIRSGVAVVIRTSKTNRRVYWLEGDLDTGDDGLERQGSGLYLVRGSLGGGSSEDPEPETVAEAAPPAPEPVLGDREFLMQRYSSGRNVSRDITVNALLPDDLIYTRNDEALVIRRGKVSLQRFWLTGELDYTRSELSKVGGNKYRVRRLIR